MNTILHADDRHFLPRERERERERETRFNIICTKLDEISTDKTQVMAFLDKNLIRSKIVIDDVILKQISHFNYLGNDYDKDIRVSEYVWYN